MFAPFCGDRFSPDVRFNSERAERNFRYTRAASFQKRGCGYEKSPNLVSSVDPEWNSHLQCIFHGIYDKQLVVRLLDGSSNWVLLCTTWILLWI
jgi:hypothetical protein